ncbi:hypothetical protein PR048_017347 [Dryococelus australis]|uniref:Uncharacterized protein n=1 Tax=Dryococelus australis TaxID=614101 RepID=A0ABQ9H991_9NEOP|nr:hypothetical protein PR048_017347 [Dryococelus australis]
MNWLPNTSQQSNFIVTTCKYWDFLDAALRDRLLLSEFEELKFAEAVKILMEMDAVVKSAALMSRVQCREVKVVAQTACSR